MSIMNSKKNGNTSNIFGIITSGSSVKNTRRGKKTGDLDFYTYNAMPSVLWMQEAFKQEQR